MNSIPLEYNEFVRLAFADPKHIARQGFAGKQSKGGLRESGVEYFLIFDKENQLLKYKVYGSPYAIAAAEWLCERFNQQVLTFNDTLDLETIKSELAMPYNYFFILLALEDAWNGLKTDY